MSNDLPATPYYDVEQLKTRLIQGIADAVSKTDEDGEIIITEEDRETIEQNGSVLLIPLKQQKEGTVKLVAIGGTKEDRLKMIGSSIIHLLKHQIAKDNIDEPE